MPASVTAILTVVSPVRLNLARKAVNNFLRQHFSPFKLLVVNSTGQSVITNPEDLAALEQIYSSVEEIHTSFGNPSTLKNVGLRAAKTEWVICLDDDDWFHPMRLLYQMAHAETGRPCLLQYQLRVDISKALENGTEGDPTRPMLHLLRMSNGIPGTMLFPRVGPTGPWLFNEDLISGEYEELLARMQQADIRPVICENMHNLFVSGMPWPILSVAFYHGSNVLSHEQFFARRDVLVSDFGSPVGLLNSDLEQLKTIFQSYNFKVQ